MNNLSNFEYWKNEIADMPEKDKAGDGWFDLETGLPYDPDFHYRSGGKITRWKPSEDVKHHRQIARHYGGKALTGSTRQKVWGEAVRASFLCSEVLNDEQKEQLAQCGSFTNSAAFWIDNRDSNPESMTALNIVAQYRELVSLEDKHRDFLWRTNPTFEKEARRKEIKEFLASCEIKFKSDLV